MQLLYMCMSLCFFSVIIEACTLDGEEEDEVKGHLMCMMSLGLKEIKMMYKTP